MCGVTEDNMDMEPVPASVTNLTDGEEALVGRMEEIIQFFLNLLQVTGGAWPPKNGHGSSYISDGRRVKRQ
jgi:hypothetical protein